jgi:hypothetical protein
MSDINFEKALEEIRSVSEWRQQEKENERLMETDSRLHNKLYELSLHDPIVRNLMESYRSGELTFEQSLLRMVIALAEQKKQVTDDLIKMHHKHGSL